MNWLKSDRQRITRGVIFRALNLALLAAALVYIGWAGAQAGRYVTRDVLCVIPVMNEDAHFFTQDDQETARELFDGTASAERMTKMSAAAEDASAFTVYAEVSVTGRDYFDLFPVPMTGGGPWVNDGERSAVISESLAWNLFGSTCVIGQAVKIDGEVYKVTGVADQRTFAKGNGFTWISPVGEEASRANILHLKPARYNRLGSHLDTINLLEDMGRRAGDYTVTDLNAYLNGITLRGKLLLFLTGLYFIFIIGIYLYQIIKNAARSPKNMLGWAAAFACLCAAVITVTVMGRSMAFDLWTPAFAGEGLARYTQALFNTGLLAPRRYLSYNLAALYDLNIKANIAFGAGLTGLVHQFNNINSPA